MDHVTVVHVPYLPECSVMQAAPRAWVGL